MTANRVVVFGTGDVGQIVHHYLTADSPYQVVGFCADARFVNRAEFLGLPLVTFEEVVGRFPPGEYKMIIALSYRDLNSVRAGKYDQAKAKGYELVSYVSSKSVVWDNVEVGDNCIILENQTIQPFVEIGNDVTLWSGNHIGHHSTIGDHCFITSHVVVSGHVVVGPYSFLGVNSTLRDGIRLAPKTVVGAGATVVKDTVEEGVYVGAPARLIERKGSDLKYFTNPTYTER